MAANECRLEVVEGDMKRALSQNVEIMSIIGKLHKENQEFKTENEDLKKHLKYCFKVIKELGKDSDSGIPPDYDEKRCYELDELNSL